MERVIREIERFSPLIEQEVNDRQLMLDFLRRNPDALTRENTVGHVTASAWVISPDRRRVVMVYHNLYRSWSWTGGHADGEDDLLAVATREVQEETGLVHLTPLQSGICSLECLTVDGHEKKGVYVPSHLHLNVTYLLAAGEEALRAKPDENSAVGWFLPEEVATASTEPWMVERVYKKLLQRAAPYMK